MSRHVFIGTIISKPKIRLLVYRGLLPLIQEPVYVKSSKCAHRTVFASCTEGISRITRKRSCPRELGQVVGFPDRHL